MTYHSAKTPQPRTDVQPGSRWRYTAGGDIHVTVLAVSDDGWVQSHIEGTSVIRTDAIGWFLNGVYQRAT